MTKMPSPSHIALTVSVALLLASCQFGSSPQGGTPTQIQGQGLKGPFQTGATVTAREVNSPNRTATGTITDSSGNYSVTTTWDGPTTIEISGPYTDEFTGQTVNLSSSTPLRAVVNATSGSTATGQVNIATAIAAQAVLSLQASGTTISSTVVNAQNLATAQKILGSSSTTDISQVNLSNTSSSNAGQVLAFVMAVAAQSGSSNIISAVNQLANNVVNSQPLGTAVSGATSPITPTQLTTNMQAVATGGTLSVTGVGTVSVSTALSNMGTGQTTSSIASQVNTSNVATSTTGFAIQNNSVTIGAATGTLAVTNGVGTATISGTTATSNVSLVFNLKDYTNSTGTGPGTATTYGSTFNFTITPSSSSDPRTITGTVSTVNVVTNGSGGLTSVAVPVGATLTFSGKNSSGTTVTGTVTDLNNQSSFFSASGTQITINANTILNIIQNKVGGDLQNLNTAGAYTFTFGFSIPIGTDNSGSTAIGTLLPQGATTGFGYTFTGSITLT